MPEKFVVKEILTEEMVDAGEALLRELDKARVPIEAALWLYDAEGPDWRLMLTSPCIEDFYPQVYSAEEKLSPSQQDILEDAVRRVVGGSELARGLKAIDPLPGIHRKRLRKTLLGSHYIQDGLLYRAM
jgi:hypothetical protein